MVNINDLRKLKIKDLRKKFHELDEEITLANFDLSTRKSNKTTEIRNKRKDLARIATVMTELKLIDTLKDSDENKKA